MSLRTYHHHAVARAPAARVRARLSRALGVVLLVSGSLVASMPSTFAQTAQTAPVQAAPAAATTGQNNRQTTTAIGRKFAARMREGGLVGAAAVILIDNKVAWAHGDGWADLAHKVPFTPDTVMNIASISKTVTGAAMMRAVEDGLLDLDADVNRYLPFKVVNPAFPDTPITLRQLATHTSSITDREAVYGRAYHYGGDSPVALGDFLAGYFDPAGADYAAGNFLDKMPGAHRDYSNIGAALAGYIVERATGMPLDVYTRERIFVPLGMTRTAWRLSDIPTGRHATLYTLKDGKPEPLRPYSLSTYPDGGVRTSVNDLSRFFRALLNDGALEDRRILDAKTTREMLHFQFDATHHPDNVDIAELNSGLFWATRYNTRMVGHGGTDPGLKTEMLFDPAQGIGVIVFTNTALTPAGQKAYSGLIDDLFAHGQALKRAWR